MIFNFSTISNKLKTCQNTRNPSLPTGAAFPGLEIKEGLLIAGPGQEMVEIPVDLVPVVPMPLINVFARLLEGLKVSFRVAIT